MKNISTLRSSKLFQAFLSTAVLAALIGSAFNYVAIQQTNKRLLDIEVIKRDAELTTFRYTKLFSAVEEISKLPAIDYTYLRPEGGRLVQDRDLFKKVVSETTERYGNIERIFERIRPLVHPAFLVDADRAVANATQQSQLITEALYKGQEMPEGVDVATLMQARQQAEAAITESIRRQVTALTKASGVQN